MAEADLYYKVNYSRESRELPLNTSLFETSLTFTYFCTWFPSYGKRKSKQG